MIELGTLSALLTVTGEFGGHLVNSPKLWTAVIAIGHLLAFLKLRGRGPRS